MVKAGLRICLGLGIGRGSEPHQGVEVGEVAGPRWRLVLRHGRNDWDVLAGVGRVQQAQAPPFDLQHSSELS